MLKHALNKVIIILNHWLSYKSGSVICRGESTVLKTVFRRTPIVDNEGLFAESGFPLILRILAMWAI